MKNQRNYEFVRKLFNKKLPPYPQVGGWDLVVARVFKRIGTRPILLLYCLEISGNYQASICFFGSGTMASEWNYQIRLTLTAEAAKRFREVPLDSEFSELNLVLTNHRAKLKCQFDAFSEYVSEAEREGRENYALYQWTKDTIEDPEKKSKYLKSFTVYVLDEQVYSGALAEPLERDLKSLKSSAFIVGISKYDTNPEKNPQMPAKYRT